MLIWLFAPFTFRSTNETTTLSLQNYSYIDLTDYKGSEELRFTTEQKIPIG